MKMNIWNPWHGCNKYSEGCDHCYMYYLDAQKMEVRYIKPKRILIFP